jgi:hypothetical protein
VGPLRAERNGEESMRNVASVVASVTVSVGLLAVGLVACGGDDDGGANLTGADAATETGTSSGGDGDSGASSSGGGEDAGDGGNGGDAGPPKYSIGGSIVGLSGAGLVLQNNAGDDLPVNANGTFAFPGRITAGAAFAVTVKAQPTGPAQTCAVSGGSGTVGSDQVTSVVVNCAAGQYTIGGTASGLAGTAVLRNNGGNDLVVTANGGFAFSQTLANTAGYSVSVVSNPAGQTCVVGAGSGGVAAANVSNVTLTCTAAKYAVGGTLIGLDSGKALQLTNNGSDPLVRTADGTFEFGTKLAKGAPYAVTLASQPAGQTCSIGGATGTVGGSDVSSLVVNCAPSTFTVGGTISGLSGALVLANAGSEVTLTANGTFGFPGTLANGASYNATVKEDALGQTCTVTSGAGKIAGANVTNVAVACKTNTYTIGGTVVGLAGALVVQNSGGDDLNVTSEGAFTLKTPVAYGRIYNVALKSAPAGQVCAVTNGSGVVGSSNISNVLVTCTNKRTVGGTVAGLAGAPVVLRNNGGDNLNVVANGAFEFAKPLGQGQTYTVTVFTQPTGRTCVVSNGTGTIAAADVTNVSVTCAP